MRNNIIWPSWLDGIWAKSQPDPGRHPGESLAEHTWNVLARLADLVRLRPDLPRALGLPRLWHCLFWACWLHDYGKAASGFQQMLRGGARWPHRHELSSLAFLDWIQGGLTQEESQWVAAAVASHHRDANEIRHLYSSLWLSEDNQLEAPLAEIQESTVDGLWRWMDVCALPWVKELGFDSVGVDVPVLPARGDAVQTLRRDGANRARWWVKSYARFVDSLRRTDDESLTLGGIAVRGHLTSSDHMASAHTGKPLPTPSVNVQEMIARLNLSQDGLYPHQIRCGQAQGSAVLVAPTGSGKTEAALLWACAQFERGKPVPRLFYMLPYQASMNAMYDRLSERAYPGQVGLEHSRSVLALYRRLQESSVSSLVAAQEARWRKALARLHYYPVRVLSPYQMLKGPYRLPGYESLLTEFFDATVVLDEIHAYEPDRLALILATARYLREHFGTRFFLMSATLPGLLQTRLVEALGMFDTIRASSELFARFRRHRVAMQSGDLLSSRGLSLVEESARGGQSVLLCCNTVKRAQSAYEEVRCRLGDTPIDVILLHGRFNGGDRLAKERAVRDATGARSRCRRPIILVATQVVEVSLDIDLDVIYTDPAPLEALIQRFGRINRRRTKGCVPVNVFMEPADGQGIYEDDLVQGALNVLSRRDGQPIDEEQVSGWLDEAYTPDSVARWNRTFEQAYREFRDGVLLPLRAFNADDALENMFYRAFDSVHVLPASLEATYRRLMETEPLEASELLVAIRWGQFARLRSAGRVRDGDNGLPGIVDAEYDDEYGLRL